MVSISIVMPLYNVAPWVTESVTSAVQQRCDGCTVEVVVVNDGSTDGSPELAESVLRRHRLPYRVITLPNGGPSRARNIGWQHASGEWIQFLDGDDLLHELKVDVQSAEAARVGAEVSVLYSDWQRLRLSNSAWIADSELVSPRVGTDAVADLLRDGNFVATGSQLIRKSWLERVGGYDENQRLIEDVNLLVRIAIHGGEFYRVASSFPLFFYRQREGSLSRSGNEAFIEGCIRNANIAESHWRDESNLTIERAELLAGIYCQAARYFAPRDEPRFNAIVDRISALYPGFCPRAPRHLRVASRLVGYRRAEKLAVLYRKAKAITAV